MRFLCAASAAHFLFLGIIMKDYNEGMSNFEKAVELSCTNWVNEIEKEMINRTAFLCGRIDEKYLKQIDITKLINIIKSIVEENNIFRIYHCKRTAFDVKICDIIGYLRFDNIEIIELSDIHKKDTEYRVKQPKGVYKIFCPFKEEIDDSVLYKTLYNYAMDNSDILIAYSKYDDDISQQIIEKAKEKGKKIINIAKLYNS